MEKCYFTFAELQLILTSRNFSQLRNYIKCLLSYMFCLWLFIFTCKNPFLDVNLFPYLFIPFFRSVRNSIHLWDIEMIVTVCLMDKNDGKKGKKEAFLSLINELIKNVNSSKVIVIIIITMIIVQRFYLPSW